MIVTSTFFMLRELEASSLEIMDVTFMEDAVSLRLPVSKVDWQAKGCTRTWHCLCGRSLPCVMHVLQEHVELVKDTMNSNESALFPTAGGRFCTKQTVVDTIRKAVDLSGETGECQATRSESLEPGRCADGALTQLRCNSLEDGEVQPCLPTSRRHRWKDSTNA